MKKEGIFLLSGIVSLNIIVVILFALNSFVNAFDFFIRLCAVLGLTAMFVSAMLTPFQKELYAYYKKAFIKIHHFSTITGLTLITLHPVIYAINVMVNTTFVDGLKVFLPNFKSLALFWSLAGRPALILIYIALVGVLIRNALKKGWRWIHGLNYIALIWGVVHGILSGTDFYDFQSPIIANKLIMTILFLLMIAVMLATFTIKRIRMYKLQRKRQKKKQKEETIEEVIEEDSIQKENT
ncbi:MAG: hypothetical protein ACFFDW_10805 [Candidatus Thorarchaeota archaeon]